MIGSVAPFVGAGVSFVRGGSDSLQPETRLEQYLLADVTEIVEQCAPQGSDEFVFIDDASVDAVTKRVATPRRMLVTGAPKSASQPVRAGDVLVGRTHPERNAVALISPPLAGAFASTGHSVLRPRPELLDDRYLYWWVQSPEFVAGLVRRGSGGNAATVTDASVRSMPIPLPPIRDQQRIAGILDDVVQLRFERLAALDLLAEFAESLVLDAVYGADPGVLSDLVESIEYGPSAKDVAPRGTVTASILRASSITSDGDLDLTELPDRRLTPADAGRFAVRPGEVLFCRAGNAESAPRVALFRGQEPEGSVLPAEPRALVPAPSVMRLRVRPEHASDGSGEYLAAFFAGPHGTAACRSLASFTPRTLRDLAIPLPSADAREVFAQRIEQLTRARTNERIQLARLDELFAALQSNGFSGRL
ncbi:MAG: restriction endonuclease subunit S [Actinomycetota bacterium]